VAPLIICVDHLHGKLMNEQQPVMKKKVVNYTHGQRVGCFGTRLRCNPA
jgi:hypothetical protein